MIDVKNGKLQKILITVSMAAYAENAYVYVRSAKAISCAAFSGEWYYETVYIWKNEISKINNNMLCNS